MLRNLNDVLRDLNVYEEDETITGIAIIPTEKLTFSKTDGYILFTRFVIENILKSITNEKWKDTIWNVFSTLNKLQDVNVNFDSNKEDFDDYCERVSKIMENTYSELSISTDEAYNEDLIPFLEEYKKKDCSFVFFYEDSKEKDRNFEADLMKQMNNLKFEKKGSERRLIDVSYYVIGNYHEHIYDAMNILLRSITYALNCQSTLKNECYYFDVERLERDIEYAKIIIERIKFVK